MTDGPKPIETLYNGYRFRSRLEARWAVFFDALKVEYEYEVEGFDLDGVWYLPDFWLPKLSVWFEVKGPPVEPGDEAWEKAERLAAATELYVYLFAGQFPTRPNNLVGRRFNAFDKFLPDRTMPLLAWWFQCEECRLFQPGPNPTDLPCGCFMGPDANDEVVQAVLRARQARFERPGRNG